MAKASHQTERNTTFPVRTKTPSSSKYIKKCSTLPLSINCRSLSAFVLTTGLTIVALSCIPNLQTPPSSPSVPSPPLSFKQQWRNILRTTLSSDDWTLEPKLEAMAEKLRESVTFLPLKDVRFADRPQEGHTWFMSSMYDTHVEGEVQYQHFPSESSKGRVLCVQGRDTHDGSWNYYALAWPETLPANATFMRGLTFVSNNHYHYDNIWHGLSSIFPFISWHQWNSCRSPDRWILYHWGELRSKISPWLNHLMEATFGKQPHIEVFDKIEENSPVCFDEAVVMRHNEGGMSRQRRVEAYDLLRCQARNYCNMKLGGEIREAYGKKTNGNVGLTMFMRRGPRSFKNDSAVIEIFKRECNKVEECSLSVAYSSNLSFCEQVKLMSMTDILVSPHGAQLTNMSRPVLFNRWLASWSGMRYEGAWRDPDGDPVPIRRKIVDVCPSTKAVKLDITDIFHRVDKNVLREVVTAGKCRFQRCFSRSVPLTCSEDRFHINLDKSQLRASEGHLSLGRITRKHDFCQLFRNLTLYSVIIHSLVLANSKLIKSQKPTTHMHYIIWSTETYASAQAIHHMSSRVLSHSALRTSISNTNTEFGWIPQAGNPLGP
ncbi:uncharacterized protein J3R85_004986 [Psidium guajava]|nr:uncharacterized protein J3R85_004986 [Psidium guajava]